jgi:hypothetical protein
MPYATIHVCHCQLGINLKASLVKAFYTLLWMRCTEQIMFNEKVNSPYPYSKKT